MVDRDQLRDIITSAVQHANAPVLERLSRLERRVDGVESLREHVSSSDLSHQAEQASMIVHMRKLETQLTAAHKEATAARKISTARYVLNGLLHASLVALATAIGSYLAVKGIHP
jgi:hypothetical protein